MSNNAEPTFLELQSPRYFGHVQPPPIYYHDAEQDQEYIIMSVHSTEGRFCYKYDINKNTYCEFAHYPNNFEAGQHGHVVVDGRYFIFGGSSNVLGEFDLKLNVWKVHQHTNYSSFTDSLRNCRGVYVGNAINEIYVFAPNRNCIINMNSLCNGFAEIGKFDKICSREEFSLIFSESLQKLCIVGGTDYTEKDHFDTMLYLDCSAPFDKDTNNFIAFKLPMPMKCGSGTDHLCTLSYDGNIIVIFGFRQKKVWSMDIGNNVNEWIGNDFKYPMDSWESLEVIVGKDNSVYFMNTYPSDKLYHIKMSLYDFIAKDILNRYSEPLVFGFIREFRKNVKLSTEIPIDIIKLLITFSM